MPALPWEEWEKRMEGRERRRQRRRQEVAGNVVMVLDLEIQRMEAVDHQGESPEALRSPVGVAPEEIQA